jgi:hypothetical protein
MVATSAVAVNGRELLFHLGNSGKGRFPSSPKATL